MIWCFTMIWGIESKASHVMGVDITYKQIDSLKYRFNFYIYRDCNGVGMGNQIDSAVIRCGTLTRKIPLTLVKIEEVITGPQSNCNPPNTDFSGIGVEKNTYSTTVDFGLSEFSSYYNCSGWVRVEIILYSRTSPHATFGVQEIYSYAELNLQAAKTGNSSPSFCFDPVPYLGCNSQVNLSFYSTDTIESDSLSYELDHPMSAYSTKAMLPTGHYYDYPFISYYPGTLKYPYKNPNANPPIGFNLDPLNGAMYFVPTKCDDVSAYVVKVKEWRKIKDSSNAYVHIGTIRRDMMGIVSSYSVKSVNLQKFQDVWACPDSVFCMDYFPPASSKYDTIALSLIPFQSNHIISLGKLAPDTSQMCFKFSSIDAFKSSNHIGIQATNKIGNRYLISQKVIQLKPSANEDFTVDIRPWICNDYRVSLDHPTQSALGVNWFVFDQDLKQLNDTHRLKFLTSNMPTSDSKSDLLRFKSNGKYYILSVVTNNMLNCFSFWDSIEVTDSERTARLNLPLQPICPLTKHALFDDSLHSENYKYQWDINGIQTSDSMVNLFLKDANDSAHIKLQITYHEYCNIDTVLNFKAKASYKIPYYQNPEFCTGDTLQITEPQGYHSFIWNKTYTDGKIQSWSDETLMVSYTDSLNCRYSDTIQTTFHPVPVLHLNDTLFCESGTIRPGKFYNYLWSDNSTQDHFYVQNSGNYWLQVSDTNGCKSVDSFQITILPLPEITLVPDTFLCSEWTPEIDFHLNPQYTYSWSNGDTGSLLKVKNSGYHSVISTDVFGCSSVDSVMVRLIPKNPTPVIYDAFTYIFTTSIHKHEWYRNDTLLNSEISNKILSPAPGSYTVRVYDSFGCVSDFSSAFIVLNTGIVHNESIDIKISPNPSEGVFNISFDNIRNQNLDNIRITDIQDRQVEAQAIFSDGSIQIKLTASPSMYWLNLILDDGSTFRSKILLN